MIGKCCIHLGGLALALFLAAPLTGRGAAGPQAGEVFREFTFNYGASPGERFAELDPDATFKFTGEHAWGATMPRHVPRAVTLDLTRAVRAELSVEYWGGHIGTGGQRFQVNSNGWMDIPQPAGTPTAPQRYYRTLLGNNAVPIPLEHLSNGTNYVQFGAGPQIAYSFGFGFYWIYDCQFHNYSFDALEVPLALLKPGTNNIGLFSTFKGHAIEINWPGPVLMLEWAE